MADNYIRIYCNGEKVRSTGKMKWQRDMELFGFGVHWNRPSYLQDFALLEDDKARSDEIIEIFHQLESHIPHQVMKGFPDVISWDIQMIHKNKSGKMVKSHIFVPFVLIKNHLAPVEISEDGLTLVSYAVLIGIVNRGCNLFKRYQLYPDARQSNPLDAIIIDDSDLPLYIALSPHINSVPIKLATVGLSEQGKLIYKGESF